MYKLKFFSIFFKKGIDKAGWKWYYIKAVRERTAKVIENWTTDEEVQAHKKCEETVKEFEKHELKGKSVWRESYERS